MSRRLKTTGPGETTTAVRKARLCLLYGSPENSFVLKLICWLCAIDAASVLRCRMSGSRSFFPALAWSADVVGTDRWRQDTQLKIWAMFLCCRIVKNWMVAVPIAFVVSTVSEALSQHGQSSFNVIQSSGLLVYCVL